MSRARNGAPRKMTAGQAAGRLYLVWGALLGSLVMYIGVAELAGGEIRRGMETGIPLEILRNTLAGLGMTLLVLIPFLRNLLLRMPSGAPAPVVVSRYTVACIATWAMFEAFTVFGLMLYLMGDEVTSLYVGFAVSLAGMLWYRPNRETLEEMTAQPGSGK